MAANRMNTVQMFLWLTSKPLPFPAVKLWEQQTDLLPILPINTLIRDWYAYFPRGHYKAELKRFSGSIGSYGEPRCLALPLSLFFHLPAFSLYWDCWLLSQMLLFYLAELSLFHSIFTATLINFIRLHVWPHSSNWGAFLSLPPCPAPQQS